MIKKLSFIDVREKNNTNSMKKLIQKEKPKLKNEK